MGLRAAGGREQGNILNIYVNTKTNTNKFALLWGEAQLCLPYVCLEKNIAYSYPNVTYSYPKVT